MKRLLILCASATLFGCGTDTFAAADGGPTDASGQEVGAQDAPVAQDAGDASKEGSCPGTAGPAAIRITDGRANFCIDATTVTHAQYEAFAQSPAAGAILAQLPAFCPTMVVFGEPPFADPPDFPARTISWCDAWGYCRFAGKRLCGRIGGGKSLTSTETASAANDEAYFACSRGGRQAEPYGATEVPGVCDNAFPDGGNNPDAGPAHVATRSGCVGGYAGLHDMVGNVDEFYDALEFFDAGGVSYFGHRGGNWTSTKPDCSHHGGIDVGSAKSEQVGFRCCSD